MLSDQTKIQDVTWSKMKKVVMIEDEKKKKVMERYFKNEPELKFVSEDEICFHINLKFEFLLN